MYNNAHILCVIPARGGSKRLPGKNIKPFLGKPLIAWAIGAAKQSKYIDRVVVSTDDDAIATVAREWGAEVPFMRPAELASDTASLVPVVQHAVTAVEAAGEHVDIVVLLQPTNPGVQASDLDSAIEKLVSSGAKSCVAMCEIGERPEHMYKLADDGRATPFVGGSQVRTQDMPPLYKLNGTLFITPRSVLMEKNEVYDDEDGVAIVMPRERSTDIDTEADFIIAQTLLQNLTN